MVTELDALIGRGVREWRGVRRQDEVAARARLVGLPWSRSVIAAIEKGTRSITLAEAVLLSVAMGQRIADIPVGEGWVGLTSDARLELSAIRHVLSGGEPNEVMGDQTDIPARRIVRTMPTPEQRSRWDRAARLLGPNTPAQLGVDAERAAGGEAEQKVARKLGVSPVEVSYTAFGLWGRSFTAERDARVATDPRCAGVSSRSVQALRGQTTRKLTAELWAVLEKVDRDQQEVSAP